MLRIALITSDGRPAFGQPGSEAPSFGTAPEALLQGIERLRGIEVHVLSCVQHPLPSPKKLADNIWFHSLVVPKIGWMRTLYQGCIRATRKKLHEIRPDVVHGQGTERDCAISAVLSGFPNVVTIHGNMRSVAKFYRARPGTFYWLAARLESFALRRTEGVLCNSAYTETRVRSTARKTWRVPNALRLAFLNPPTQTSRGDRPVLLSVGAVAPYKQQVELLTMAGKLWQRGLRFELQFAGAVDRRPGYHAHFAHQLAEAEKGGYARHLGVLQANELVAAMDAASALVHFPSEEAFGLVVAEALARNLKLFGSSAGGVPDIATGVEGAELLPMNDWDALEHSIARWLEAGSPRPSEAATVMRQRYHPEVIARRHLEIYREISGSSSDV